MQTSLGHDSCDKESDATISPLWQMATHTDSGPYSGTAATASSNAQALVPIRDASAARRASHCSGFTGIGGQTHSQSSDASWETHSVFARRKASTDIVGSDTSQLARFRTNSHASDRPPGAARQPRRNGVQFTTDDDGGGVSGIGGGSSDTDGADSDASVARSADEGGFSRRRGRKCRPVLELPALPASGGTASASAKVSAGGGGATTTAAAGPAGVTLAWLETLRSALSPCTTLRDVYSSLVLPATRVARCAYVAMLGAEHRARPTHVVVCSWDERISDVVDCVADHLAAVSPQPGPENNNNNAFAAFTASGRLALRRSAECPPTDYHHHTSATAATVVAAAPFSNLGCWSPLVGAPSWMSGQTAGSPSRSPSPGPSAGPSPVAGMGTAGGGGGGGGSAPHFAVWLDLFAVNFHPPTAGVSGATAAAAAAGSGAAVWPLVSTSRPGSLSPLHPMATATMMAMTSSSSSSFLEDVARERARELPAAIASTRNVLLLPGAQGTGFRDLPVALAAWHALRGRGCAGGVTLSVAVPADVDVALMQAAFQNLMVSSVKGADEGGSAAAAAGAAGQSGGALGVGVGTEPAAIAAADGAMAKQPSSTTHMYASPDRLAMRAVREGIASGAAAAAAVAAIYAVDPLPSRTVREGLMTAAMAAANMLLARPVVQSGGRASLLQHNTMTSLPAAAVGPVSAPLLQPSTPQPLSPTPQPQFHSTLQGRSFSVNTFEHPSYSSYTPSQLFSRSRPSHLSQSLRPGPAAAGAAPGPHRTVPLATEAAPCASSSPSLAAAAASVGASDAAAMPRAAPAVTPTAASAVARLLSVASEGRSLSSSSLPSGHVSRRSNDDDDDGGGGGDGAGCAVTSATEPQLRLPDGGGGGGSRDPRGRVASTLVSGVADLTRGSSGLTTAAAAAGALPSTASYDNIAGIGFRRPRNLIPPIDASALAAPSPSAPPPATPPVFADPHTSGSGSFRLMQLRSCAVAPWGASAPLSTVTFKSTSGLAANGPDATRLISGGAGGDGWGAGGVGGPKMPGTAAAAADLTSPTLREWSSMEALAPSTSQPLPRLAPLQLYNGAPPMATAAAAMPALATAAGGKPASAGLATAAMASASLPAPLPYRDVMLSATAAAAALPASPFGKIRKADVRTGPIPTCRWGSGAAGQANEPTADGGAGSDRELDPDPMPSDAENEDASDSSSVGPAIVLDMANSFLVHHHSGAIDGYDNEHTQLAVQEQSHSSGVGGGAAAGGIKVAQPGPPPSASPELARFLPPSAPSSPPLYEHEPYRPLAPDLARLVGTGRLLAAMGQPSMALRIVQHAVTAARSFHGSNHPDAARCAAALGWLLVLCPQQQQQQQQQSPLLLRPGSDGQVASGRASGGGGVVGSVDHRGWSPSRATTASPAPRDRVMVGEAAVAAGSGGGSGGSATGPSVGPQPHFRAAAAAAVSSPGNTRLKPASSPAAATAAGTAAGSLVEAEVLLRGASMILERFLGHRNEETLSARQGLAAVMMAAGRYDEAVPVLQRAANAPAASSRTAAAVAASRWSLSLEVAVGSAIDLATCLAVMGRATEARKLLRAQLVRLQEDEDEAAAAAAATAMATARGGRAPAAPAKTSHHLFGSSSVTLPSSLQMSTPTPLFALRPSYGTGDGSTAARGGWRAGGSTAAGGMSGCVSPIGPSEVVAVQFSNPSVTQQQLQPSSSSSRGLTTLKREELRARCAHQLAQLKAACGKAQAARALYRMAVQSYAAVYGISHTVTASCMLDLAALNHSLREYGEALEMYRVVLELYVEIYGPHHPATTKVSNQLGDLEEEVEEEEEEERGQR